MEAQLPNLSGVVDIDPMWRSTMAAARAYLRDYAKLNILLEEEETDDKTLLLCLQMTVVDVNSTPPPTSWSLRGMLDRGYVTIVLFGVMVHVLESLSLLETRNHLNWNEGGQQLALQDRLPALSERSRYFRDVYQSKLEKKKISDSITEALDPENVGVHSEYYAINGWIWP